MLFSFFFMSMPMRICTCLRCVKMNLVISTSKMTNCHDGLSPSRSCARTIVVCYTKGREKKSCSALYFIVTIILNLPQTTSDQCHFSSLMLSCSRSRQTILSVTLSKLDLSPCRIYFYRRSINKCHFVAYKSH